MVKILRSFHSKILSQMSRVSSLSNFYIKSFDCDVKLMNCVTIGLWIWLLYSSFFASEYQNVFEEYLSCLVLWTLTSVIEIPVSNEGN